MSSVSLAATAAYLPEHWMTAAEVSERSGIPEQVIVEKFGLRGKHIAAADEHVSPASAMRTKVTAMAPASTPARCCSVASSTAATNEGMTT